MRWLSPLHRAAPATVVAALMVLWVQPASGFEPVLRSVERQAAIDAGKSAALAHRGYSVASYTVYAVPDALAITPGEGAIDAVVVGTPFERVKYASYLAHFQGQAPSPKDVEEAATPNEIEFVVFAHSSGKLDPAFLSHFTSVSLSISGRTPLAPISRSTFGPTVDFYNVVGKGREERWLGYDTFAFDLRSLKVQGVDIARLGGTFAVIDPNGHKYSLPFDLSKYR